MTSWVTNLYMIGFDFRQGRSDTGSIHGEGTMFQKSNKSTVLLRSRLLCRFVSFTQKSALLTTSARQTLCLIKLRLKY